MAPQIDFKKLQNEQIKLASQVILSDSLKKIKTIAGAQQTQIGNDIVSMIAVLHYPSFERIEQKHAQSKSLLSYTSGFLFYREGPAVIEAFKQLENKPDLLMVLGNGILHPRRLGMASHLGIVLDIPTIGIAKNKIAGELRDHTLYLEKEARGYEVLTREHAKPIYISPGHKVSLQKSIEIVKSCIVPPHKLPEPLHVANKLLNKMQLGNAIDDSL